VQPVTDILGAYDVSRSDAAYMGEANCKLRNRARHVVPPVHAVRVAHAAEDPDDRAVWMPDLSYGFANANITLVDGLPADIAYNSRCANISSQVGGAIGKSGSNRKNEVGRGRGTM
jgi:hypothetical protein